MVKVMEDIRAARRNPALIRPPKSAQFVGEVTSRYSSWFLNRIVFMWSKSATATTGWCRIPRSHLTTSKQPGV